MDKNTAAHILLADDQANVRAALRLLLEQETNVVIAGEADDAAGLLLAAATYEADVLLLDWELPGLPIDHLLKLLRAERPYLRILAMSSRPEARQQALHAGVTAFLSKGAPPEAVLTALRQVTWPTDRQP